MQQEQEVPEAQQEQVALEAQAAQEQAELEARAAAQLQQDAAINAAQAAAQPAEQQVVPVAAPASAPATVSVPSREEGVSRYDYARQIFEVLKGGAAIDRNLAQEYEPELRQIIREERAKGTLPQ